jgi:hypothetical protein
MNEAINVEVTISRFDEIIDLDDSFHLGDMSMTRAYEYLCEFVVDETGAYIGAEKAKALFKQHRIKRKEIGQYWLDFVQKVNVAFINPPSAATSEEPS